MQCVKCKTKIGSAHKKFLVCSDACFEEAVQEAGPAPAIGEIVKIVSKSTPSSAARYLAKEKDPEKPLAAWEIEVFESVNKKSVELVKLLQHIPGLEKPSSVQLLDSGQIAFLFPVRRRVAVPNLETPASLINACCDVVNALKGVAENNLSYSSLTGKDLIFTASGGMLAHTLNYARMGDRVGIDNAGHHFFSPEKLSKMVAGPEDDTYAVCLSLCCSLSRQAPVWIERGYTLEQMRRLAPSDIYAHLKAFADGCPVQATPLIQVLKKGLVPEEQRPSLKELAYELDSIKGQFWYTFSPKRFVDSAVMIGKELSLGIEVAVALVPCDLEKSMLLAVECIKDCTEVAPVIKTIPPFSLGNNRLSGIMFDASSWSAYKRSCSDEHLHRVFNARGITTTTGKLFAMTNEHSTVVVGPFISSFQAPVKAFQIKSLKA